MWNTELWGKRYKKSGRIGRLDYLKSQLFLLAIALGFWILGILTLSKAVLCIGFAYGCVYLWLSFCLIAKRLHDVGSSSWPILIPILLSLKVTINSHTYSILKGEITGYIAGGLFIVFLIVLLCVKGTSKDNKYGKSLR